MFLLFYIFCFLPWRPQEKGARNCGHCRHVGPVVGVGSVEPSSVGGRRGPIGSGLRRRHATRFGFDPAQAAVQVAQRLGSARLFAPPHGQRSSF